MLLVSRGLRGENINNRGFHNRLADIKRKLGPPPEPKE